MSALRGALAAGAATLVALVGLGSMSASAAEAPVCQPSPYAADQYFPAPAFADQTRAPAPAQGSSFKTEVFASGLVHPWSLAFLPDGRMLVTERPGRMRIIDESGRLSEPIAGLPPFVTVAAEGLHDVALDPDFAHNRLIYFSYFGALPGAGASSPTFKAWVDWLKLSPAERETHKLGVETVARARLSQDGRSLADVKVILQGANRRLVFARDGTLLVTSATPAGVGVLSDDGPLRLDTPYGKVLRIRTDGSPPRDNPFIGRPGARPEVFAVGLRDPEGATLDPGTGDLWTVEHGPRGGDELNHIRAGRNYGYPAISYGREYSEQLIDGGITAKAGLEQPIYFWTPSIAPSGLLFYTGTLFPDWRGDIFAGAMAGHHLMRLVMRGGKVKAEEDLLVERCKRIRDVRQGPEGALYILTDEDAGEVLRLTPGP